MATLSDSHQDLPGQVGVLRMSRSQILYKPPFLSTFVYQQRPLIDTLELQC